MLVIKRDTQPPKKWEHSDSFVILNPDAIAKSALSQRYRRKPFKSSLSKPSPVPSVVSCQGTITQTDTSGQGLVIATHFLWRLRKEAGHQ